MKKGLSSIILVATTILFFSPVLLTPYIWGFRDFHRYIYPIRFFARESILSGIIPFWNPYLAGGMPFLASLQTCVFYPPSIFIYILPFNLGLKFYVLFHFALAGISMYLLSRELGLCKTSSLIASIVWSFSGWMVSSIDIVIILASSAWLGLILLFALKSKDSLFYSILTGLTLSFQFLAGEPSVFYFTLLFLFCFSFYFRLGLRRTILSILIGIGLSLFQLLPFLEMVSYSTRLHSQESSTYWAFVPYELFSLILPSATGDIIRNPQPYLHLGQIWLKSSYFGIIPFILSVAVIFSPKKERAVSFFSLLSLFTILLSFGGMTPLYKLLQALPLFSFMRYSVKWLYLATFSLSILAGFSASYILKRDKSSLMLILFSACSIFFLLAFCFFTNYSFLSQFFAESIMIRWAGDLSSDSLFILIILGLFIITSILFRQHLVKEGWHKTLLFGLILIDLFWFSEGLNPLIRESLYKEPGIVKIFKSDKDRYFRFCHSPETNKHFSMVRGRSLEEAIENVHRYILPNIGMLFGLFDAGAYDSIYLEDYYKFRWFTGIAPFQIALPLVSMMNIKYIVSKWPIKGEGIRLVYSENELFLYENSRFLARALFIQDFKVIKDRMEVLNYIFSDSFSPEKEVVLEEEVRSQKSGVRSQKSEVRSQK